MNTLNYPEEGNLQDSIFVAERKYKFSFSSFQKAVIANCELRKQIDDIVDLGLFEFAFRKNTEFIQKARARAEDDSVKLLMQFVNGVGDYNLVRRIIHRNRVIRALAIKDRKDQRELIKRLTHN
jgi:hypothetical protein